MPGINGFRDHLFGISTKKSTMTSTFVILPLLLASQLLIFGAQGDELPEIVTTELPLPEGYIAHTDIGAAYKIYTDEFVNWGEAEQNCTMDGAHLAVIDSPKKLEYAKSEPLGDGVRHVGIQKVNGEWVSVTNATIAASTIPWAEGEGSIEVPNEEESYNFAMIGWSNKYTQLITGEVVFSGDYVCEIPLPK